MEIPFVYKVVPPLPRQVDAEMVSMVQIWGSGGREAGSGVMGREFSHSAAEDAYCEGLRLGKIDPRQGHSK